MIDEVVDKQKFVLHLRSGLNSSSPVSLLLADHLGSTTITVYAGTGRLQSLSQYTAWGEEYSSYGGAGQGQ